MKTRNRSKSQKQRQLPLMLLLLFSFLHSPALFAQEEEGKRIIFDDPNQKKEGTLLTEEDLQQKRNGWGIDLMISDDGFGFGAFYHHEFSDIITGTFSTSFSEAKDAREFEYYTYWGDVVSPNKLNRIFRTPMFFGIQYRLFKETIADNFRPFLNLGAGPVFIYTTPYEHEWFKSFGYGHPYWTYGGFFGMGAHFGFDRGTILGVNFRYYIIPLPEGIQGVYQGPKLNANGFFITLNFGAAY